VAVSHRLGRCRIRTQKLRITVKREEIPEAVVSAEPEVVELHHDGIEREEVVAAELVGLHIHHHS
jgi:hypothetical protein